MAEITAQMVRDLREKTGAGMMDCKKALEAAGGNVDGAIKSLREKGLASAKKKADRVAAEGLVGFSIKGNVASLVEVNCETDFVARNQDFEALVASLAAQVANPSQKSIPSGVVEDVSPLLAMAFESNPSKTVEELLNDKIATIGEKLSIRRFARFDQGNAFGGYLHSGGSIGVLVELKVGDEAKTANSAVVTMAKDLAMHVAAANPSFVRREEVGQAKIQEEREIFRALALKEGKPEKMMDRIIEGKLERHFGENCLLEQSFVKDPDTTVGKLVEKVAKELGTTISVNRFARFKVGEGIEKKSADFTAEVARMAS